jgi:hypothetical protein
VSGPTGVAVYIFIGVAVARAIRALTEGLCLLILVLVAIAGTGRRAKRAERLIGVLMLQKLSGKK